MADVHCVGWPTVDTEHADRRVMPLAESCCRSVRVAHGEWWPVVRFGVVGSSWELLVAFGQLLGVESDSSLVRASFEVPECFGELFERHHRVIWTYLARLCGPDVADELAAEVFVTAFERRASYDPERGEVRSWFYGIATNLLRTSPRAGASAAGCVRSGG
jgi:hypothetical protein